MREVLCSNSNVSPPRAAGITLGPPPPSPPFWGHLRARGLWIDSLSAHPASASQVCSPVCRPHSSAPIPIYPVLVARVASHTRGGGGEAEIMACPSLNPHRDFHCLQDQLQTPTPGPGPSAVCPLPPSPLPHCCHSGTTLHSKHSRGGSPLHAQFPCLYAPPPTLKPQFQGLTPEGLPQPCQAPLAPVHAPLCRMEAMTCFPDWRGCVWGSVCPAPLSSWGAVHAFPMPRGSGGPSI